MQLAAEFSAVDMYLWLESRCQSGSHQHAPAAAGLTDDLYCALKLKVSRQKCSNFDDEPSFHFTAVDLNVEVSVDLNVKASGFEICARAP